MIWFAVLAGSIGCYVEKLVGHLLPTRVLEREGVRRVAGLLPVVLLAGLVAPDRGTVTIGGVDAREIEPRELRDAVSLVFQESFLFADRVGENIAVGKKIDRVAEIPRLGMNPA